MTVEESGVLHRRIVESSVDGIWVMDRCGRILYANERAAAMLGRTSAQLVGMEVPQLLDGAGRVQFRQHLEQLTARAEDNSEDVEVQYLRPDGAPVLLLVSETLMRDESGALVGIVHRMTPDANRRAMLAELTRSRKQLDEAQAIARVGSWEFDLAATRVTWSAQMFAMLGLDASSFVPTVAAFVERIVPQHRAQVEETLLDAFRSPRALSFDCQMVRADGSVGWFRGLGRPVSAHDGTVTTLRGTVQDITDIKEAELQLVDALTLNELLQVMASAANRSETLIDALEVTRRVLLEHPDWARAVAFKVVAEPYTSGLIPLRVEGRNSDPVRPTPVEETVAARALTEGPVVFEEREQPDTPSIGFALTGEGHGEVVVVITAASPFERHDMLRAMVGQVADQLGRVAERERVARDLAAARDAAMEASRLKSEFLAIMSHEIRTPMNGVIGLNELLLQTDLDARQRRLVEGVQVAGQSLLGLINDILDFSKIEAGELALEVVDFDVRAVFDQTTTLLTSIAEDKGITLDVVVADDVPLRLTGDPTRFGQVLSNLMSNAVKFTEHGEVRVRAEVAERCEGAALLRVEVSDTGIGIGESQRTRLFEPFRQADASTTRTFGGTGLGLAIARRLVVALGGDIGVASELGEGSTFWFTGRFELADGARAGADRDTVAAPADALGGRRGHVLLVEDNDINQLVALGMLEAAGYTTDVAEDGEAAVRSAAANRYDAVLMDLRMPVMDGYAASRAIRAAEPPGRRVPIIAMTASAGEAERERCLAAGMDDFLAKPVSSVRLAAALRAWVRRTCDAVVALDTPPSEEPPALNPARLDELRSMGERAVPLVDRALTNFVSGLPTALAGLRAAVRATDAQEVEALAHRLRGGALNLGAERLADCCLRVETAAQAGAVGEVSRLLGALDDAGAEAVEVLGAWRQAAA